MESFEESLKDALEQAYMPRPLGRAGPHPSIAREGPWSRFTYLWFRDHGSAYFFLFRKNLSVTNLQLGELLSLARQHIAPARGGGAGKGSSMARGVQFVTMKEYRQIVEDGLSFLVGDNSGNKVVREAIQRFVTHYGDLLKSTVVYDPLYTSCGILLPPGLRLALDRVAAESTYTHSCGKSVFSRNVSKVTVDYFKHRLNEYLLQNRGNTDPCRFLVYYREHFDAIDSDQANELAHGLDGTKIHMDKFFVGALPLVAVMQELRTEFKDVEFSTYGRLTVPMRTIWLLTDRHFDASSRRVRSGRERYYIAYEQSYACRNPFVECDENKPAWNEHTTLPHSITGALLNLSRASLRSSAKRRRKTQVLDPFVGSGTTIVEAAKFADTVAQGYDIDGIARIVVGDNLLFFGSQELQEEAGEQLGRLVDRYDVRTDASAGLEALVRECGDDRRFGELLEEAKEDFGERIRVYVARRVNRRAANALVRMKDKGRQAVRETIRAQFLRECKLLEGQVARVCGLERGTTIDGTHFAIMNGGKYSKVATVTRNATGRLIGKGRGPVRIGDAVTCLRRDTREGKRWDIVLTDPPYGVNKREGAGASGDEKLSALYARLIPPLVDSIRSGGILVICLPSVSFNGQAIPSFVKPSTIRARVLLAADRAGREARPMPSWLPWLEGVLDGRLYWESERVLRREILFFEIG